MLPAADDPVLPDIDEGIPVSIVPYDTMLRLVLTAEATVPYLLDPVAPVVP
jgi:hypothetical protein